ncbi:MAG: small basic protein [Planctomycetota bacterium]
MSLDSSLRSGNSLKRHRNVLTRAERLEKLLESGKRTESDGVYGLPKVGNRKPSVGKKTVKKKDDDEKK